MQKTIESEHPLTDHLAKRWSPRGFTEQAVNAKTLRSLLEAARWAPSSSNEQPWQYIVATKDNPAEFSKMLACLVDANQVWAKNAPVLMISVATDNSPRSGKPNRHAQHDTGIASALLSVQATAMGLQAHMMAGFDPEKARQTYNIPAGFTPMAAIAVGYPGDVHKLSEEHQKRETAPRARKPQNEFVFAGTWGSALK